MLLHLLTAGFGTHATCRDDAPRSAFGGKPQNICSRTASDPERLEAWYHPSIAWMAPNRRGHMGSYIARRKFLAALGGAAAAWPLAEAEPNINLLDLVSIPAAADWDASFTVKCINL